MGAERVINAKMDLRGSKLKSMIKTARRPSKHAWRPGPEGGGG